ncbi:GIY-YIG nuclease family protein [Enterococcus sp. BWR-S5]|uniref:GIY-YIG nuclease family protein n=1 Tax=Enterococcus sp. BWR-S5 TaxID=2787714 RepID=UPI0019232960|nr:GIY-YIG nuclease family protein [Enterococcus sp. BWR-S5]MBL1227540.1 GIY-YIG nuclease family protein [Enterococcus sp. BWR-S5]
MNEKLKTKAKGLPLSPGVYLMRDKTGTILYIGKAKKLKERVSSYFINSKNHSTKTKRMLLHLTDFDIIQTDTELDALLLECRLIQQHRPMYNRQMNAFERYSYMNISMGKETIKLSISSVPSDSYSFGPYAVYRKLPEIKAILDRLYCLNPEDPWHQLYAQSLTPEASTVILDELLEAFTGKSERLEKRMEAKMLAFAEQLHFIQAAQWRDDLALIHYFFQKHSQLLLHPISQKEWHTLWLPTEKGQKCYLIYQGLVVMEQHFPDLITKNKRILRKRAKELIPASVPVFRSFSKEQIDFITILHAYLQRETDYQLLSVKK